MVSEVFGHASVATTGDIYGHVSPDVSREALIRPALAHQQIQDRRRLIMEKRILGAGLEVHHRVEPLGSCRCFSASNPYRRGPNLDDPVR